MVFIDDVTHTNIPWSVFMILLRSLHTRTALGLGLL